jgi:type I restriction enzyme S subunit
MRLETFFEEFDQFAQAPNAAAQLRELVLCTAFSGALSGEARDQPMPGEWAVEGAPLFPAIPSSWRWLRGSDVFDVIRGVSYKKNDASDSPVEGFVPVLRANNIGNVVNFNDLVYVPSGNVRDEQFVRRGDILIAMSSGSRKLVGKAAPIVTGFAGAFGAFCGVIRNQSTMPDEVLARFFQSPQYISWVTAAGRGIGINNLGRGDLDALPVPTPPLAEQKRIAAKMNELMALCDRLEAQQQERQTRHAALARASLARFAAAPTPANLNYLFHNAYTIEPVDLRKTILTLAIRGLLVQHDQQASGWETRNLKSLTTKIGSGSTPLGGRESYQKSGVPLIRSMNVHFSGFVRDGLAFLNEEQTEKLKNVTVKADDVLLNITGASIGRVTTAPRDMEGARVNQHVCIVRPTAEILPRFLAMCLASPVVQDRIDEVQVGATREALTKAMIEQFEVPVPSLAEQRRIVAKVDTLMALVDDGDRQAGATRATAAALLEAVVAELTTQA